MAKLKRVKSSFSDELSRDMKRSNRSNPRADRNSKRNSNNVIELDNFRQRSKKIEIIPRSVAQEDYIQALEDDDISMVFGIGPAGTGKSLVATTVAIKMLVENRINKIVITRPNVAVDDRDIGYTPGDINSKLFPWCMPIMEVFAEHYSQGEIAKMLEEKIIELVPIAYIRGRTFKNAFVILDEAQGTTPNSLKAVLTRIGENSKMAITGDLAQSDHRDKNGLSDFIARLENHVPKGISLVKFTNKDIQRHPVVGRILELYGE